MSLAEALNQARLPIIDFKTCRQKKFWGDRVRDSMICAGFRDTEGPPAACQVEKGRVGKEGTEEGWDRKRSGKDRVRKGGGRITYLY